MILYSSLLILIPAMLLIFAGIINSWVHDEKAYKKVENNKKRYSLDLINVLEKPTGIGYLQGIRT